MTSAHPVSWVLDLVLLLRCVSTWSWTSKGSTMGSASTHIAPCRLYCSISTIIFSSHQVADVFSLHYGKIPESISWQAPPLCPIQVVATNLSEIDTAK